MASQLHLAPGQPRTLAYGQAIRKDLKLLEVDEELLDELLHTGQVFSADRFQVPAQPVKAGGALLACADLVYLCAAKLVPVGCGVAPLLLPPHRRRCRPTSCCRLSLKGRAGEEAVLCSGSKTYAVKNVETTNLVLLLQEADRQAVPVAALGSQDANVPPQATPPGMLLGLGTQLQKVGGWLRGGQLLQTSLWELEMQPIVLHRPNHTLWLRRNPLDFAEPGCRPAGACCGVCPGQQPPGAGAGSPPPAPAGGPAQGAAAALPPLLLLPSWAHSAPSLPHSRYCRAMSRSCLPVPEPLIHCPFGCLLPLQCCVCLFASGAAVRCRPRR